MDAFALDLGITALSESLDRHRGASQAILALLRIVFCATPRPELWIS
jgi:hypothetical protein